MVEPVLLHSEVLLPDEDRWHFIAKHRHAAAEAGKMAAHEIHLGYLSAIQSVGSSLWAALVDRVQRQ